MIAGVKQIGFNDFLKNVYLNNKRSKLSLVYNMFNQFK